MWADRQVLSRPLRLHWAGWETTTYALQQAGWSLAAEEDVYMRAMRLALKHSQFGVQGVTRRVPFEYMGRDMLSDGGPGIVIPVDRMASRIDFMVHETSLPDFRAIDAEPQLLQLERKRLEDFVHFATPLARTQEIIVPESSVPELLERILKMQQPAKTGRLRAEVRNERLGEPAEPSQRQRLHAQIVSLAA